MRSFIYILGAQLVTVSLFPANGANEKTVEAARKYSAEAGKSVAHGAFDAAIDNWKAAENAWRKTGDQGEQIDALINLASAYHALGQQKLAVESLGKAMELASTMKDSARSAAVYSSLGAVQTLSHKADSAEENLQKALSLARATKNPKVTSSTLNSFGNLKASQGDLPSAIGFYEEAIRSAAGSGARTLEATSRTNLANAMARNGAFDKAVKLNAGALQLASQLDNSHEKAFCLLRAGKTWELLFEKEPSHPAQRRVAALRAYEDAARLAATIGDDRALSFSLGYAGHLYEQEKKMDDALRLTARATSFAQGLKSPDILYQWEWQAGRILRAQRQFNAAIDAFGRSVESLEKIRTGLSTHLGNANARSSYRGAVSDAYFSLADLLLARADRQQDGAKAEKDVREACEVCEKLKSVELADYFQDDCVNLLQKKKEDIFKANPNKRGGKSGDDIWGEGFPGTAIVYFIPLPDRIETIVRLGGEFHRRKVQVGSEQLRMVARKFRTHLVDYRNNKYLTEARQLYDWLIRPLDSLFEAKKIDTLVFVPDDPLRSVPMGAFLDGKTFLIEKYAVAVSPGLTLIEPHRMDWKNASLFANGLSQAVPGFRALPAVDDEIKQITQSVPNNKTLKNEKFLKADFETVFEKGDFSVVHIASHGMFSGDVRKTFVLAYDKKLFLNAMEAMIRPKQLNDKPVEMLCLSACETAVGDERAALGLAGVAVKVGARSAFATLWCVEDNASSILISEFYRQLVGAKDSSKAMALRNAQMQLLAIPRYDRHPFYWAPYLIIGNWL